MYHLCKVFCSIKQFILWAFAPTKIKHDKTEPAEDSCFFTFSQGQLGPSTGGYEECTEVKPQYYISRATATEILLNSKCNSMETALWRNWFTTIPICVTS